MRTTSARFIKIAGFGCNQVWEAGWLRWEAATVPAAVPEEQSADHCDPLSPRALGLRLVPEMC